MSIASGAWICVLTTIFSIFVCGLEVHVDLSPHKREFLQRPFVFVTASSIRHLRDCFADKIVILCLIDISLCWLARTISIGGTTLASLPIDILGLFSAHLYARSFIQLYGCGDKVLNVKLTRHGGASTLRYHIGHPHQFATRGVEHRGHFTRVPLDFPVEGVSYLSISQHSKVLKCFDAIKHFSMLKVLSVYSYRAFLNAAAEISVSSRFTSDLMRSLPATLEIIELRFPLSIVSILNDSSSWSKNLEVVPPGMWLPFKDLFPQLKTLSVWTNWANFTKVEQLSEAAKNDLVASLPTTLEHLDVEFLGSLNFETIGTLPLLQTLAVGWKGRPGILGSPALFSHLPTNLIRLIHRSAPLTREHISVLPQTLGYLDVLQIVADDVTAPLPFPPYLTYLSTQESDTWTPRLVQKLPPLECFRLYRLRLEDLSVFSALSANCLTFHTLVQLNRTAYFKIEKLSALNVERLQQVRVTSSPAFKSDLVKYTPLWASLRTLTLLGCHLSESCLLSLPKTLILLEIESIRGNGHLLDPATTIVNQDTISQSIISWCRIHLPKMEAIPPITCVSVTSVPSGVEDIVLDYSKIRWSRLKHLKVLRHFSGYLDRREGPPEPLPTTITEVDWTGCSTSFNSHALGLMPPSLTRFKGDFLSVSPPLNKEFDLSPHLDVLSFSFPDDFPALADGWTHVQLASNVVLLWYPDNPKLTITHLPPNLTELKLRGLEAVDGKVSPGVYFDTSRLRSLPLTLRQVTFIGGALKLYPLTWLPPTLTDLEMSHETIDAENIVHLQKFTELKRLVIRDRIQKWPGQFIEHLPPNLTTLHVNVQWSTSDPLPPLPKSLTQVSFTPENLRAENPTNSEISS